MAQKNESCEALMKVLHKVIKEKNCTMIDAVLVLAEEMDLEIDEFVSKFDNALLDQLREEAIQEGMVRFSVLPITIPLDL